MGSTFKWLSLVCASVSLALALSHCVADQVSPLVVVVDGGTVVGEASVVGDGPYSLAGNVDGLPATATVSLTLNGANALTAKNGMFTFPAVLLGGQSYLVVAGAATQGYSCTAQNGSGTVAAANVTGVVVHCTSADATLSALSISSASLSPAFSAPVLSYSAGVRISGLFASAALPPTTITATSSDPGSTITIAGVPVKSGTKSGPVTVKAGANPIDIAVTASDGKAQKHYVIAATGLVNDYFKASNTLDHTNYGWSTALSADGSTLAVGCIGDRSNANGINGDPNNVLAPGSGSVFVYTRAGVTWTQQAYVKASNTGGNFGVSVALSADGNTLGVGANNESSASPGINGVQNDTSVQNAGAVYIFTRAGTTWSQQAYIKAAHPRMLAYFGTSVAVSTDGNTLAVGANGETSNAIGINGDDTNTSLTGAGAAYVFVRGAGVWSQQAYVKASNTRANASFGAVAISGDGNTLAVGANGESSNQTGINGPQGDTSMNAAGAVYVFLRTGSAWAQQAYVKASNTRASAFFGSVALSADGNTLAVGSFNESSASPGINGDQANTSAGGAGAVYVFTRSAAVWTQQAYVKASTPRGGSSVGLNVSLSADGNTLAAAAPQETSVATGINGDQTDTSAFAAGAVYVFTRAGGATWSQLAYVKASNTRVELSQGAFFGDAIALSGDAKTLAVGANGEYSKAKGVNGDQTDDSMMRAGAAYVF